MGHLPRTAVVAEAKRGNQDAFLSLVEPYRGRLYSLVWRFVGQREDVEDLTQEALLRAYRYLRSFRDEGDFGAWLMQIAVNVCIAHCGQLRAKKRWWGRPAAERDRQQAVGGTSAFGDPETEFERQAVGERVREEIGQLPRAQQAAVMLFEMEDLSLREAAAVMQCSVGTVKKHLHRARETLADRLSDLLE